ncbi:MAG: hypothetical protein QOK38_839 [Acidobacteriaceae bacterium]|nr:hypothetical protein [Acidobacteriaceae bacterium]
MYRQLGMAAAISPAERNALGHSRRKQLRRQEHAQWRPAAHRLSPVTTIARSMRGRIASLVALKYERMLASPFGFFRGAVPVMAADLATLPNTGILSQICGDAHVRNLGAYAAPDGRLVFDINDFDETCAAPFEWDLKRMATSLVLAGRENGHKSSACGEAVFILAQSYRRLAASLARTPVMELARYQVHRLERVTPVSEALRKAERETPLGTLGRFTEESKPKEINPDKSGYARRRFKDEPPLLTRLPLAQARAVLASFAAYRNSLLPERRHFLDQYVPVDVVFKVVGTGSVGLRDYLVYLEGNGANDPLFLQIKEEPGSAYAPYLAAHGAARAATHQGQRVAEGQRAMQWQSDPFLGWTTIANRDYLVRQLNDHKASVDLEALQGAGLAEYAAVCGELLARGHARSGDVHLITGYLGAGSKQDKFDHALGAFAEAYADQTEADWHALVASRKRAAPKAKVSASPAAK